MNITDRFLYFTYNGVHSSEFGAFYENNGEDISFPFSHAITHKTASPLYQNRSYWLGANKGNKEFNLNIAVADKTLYEAEEIFEWLDPSKPGELVIDYRPNYTYKVLITNIQPPTIIPKQLINGLVQNILLFSIKFTTYENHLAETTNYYTVDSADRLDKVVLYEYDHLLPIMFYDNTYNFINWSNENQFIEFVINGSEVKIGKKDKNEEKTYYEYSLATSRAITIDSEIGSMTQGDNLIEFLYPKRPISNKGPMPIKPSTIYRGPIDLSVTGTTIAVTPNTRFEQLGAADDYVMVIDPVLTKDTPMVDLDASKGDEFSGLYPGTRTGNILKLDYPIYFMGKLTAGNKLTFQVGDNDIISGKYKVRIAAVTKINVQAHNTHIMKFKYRKGV